MATQESKAKRQRILLIAGIVALVIAALLVARNMSGGKSAESLNAERVYKCVECGHDFERTLKIGDSEPFACPKCGKMSAYRAEACYWAKDAAGGWKAKAKPTFVVLKSRVDSNSTEKTYCPDCGHIVVGHNPRPRQDLMEAADFGGGTEDGMRGRGTDLSR